MLRLERQALQRTRENAVWCLERILEQSEWCEVRFVWARRGEDAIYQERIAVNEGLGG